MDLTWKTITELAREQRNNPTPAERTLWKILRKKQLNGYRFLRQKPIVYEQHDHRYYFFIADFYCSELKLVIELDGRIHDFQKEFDHQRDVVLNGLGLRVLHIRNEELRNMDAVITKISSYMK